jgi:hypothetical protein
MQYLLLIYHSEQNWEKMSDAEHGKIFQDYMEFSRRIHSDDHYRGGNRLDVSSKATTVRVRDGKRVLTDGPFAETKEQLGGYYLIEARDLDEALAVAELIPGARYGSIEVRPVVPVQVPELV